MTGRRVVRRVALRAMSTVVLPCALVGGAVVTAGVLAGHWRVVPVLSGSMRPSIAEDSAVLAVAAPLESVERGDVIVDTPPGADHLLMHRVIEVVEPGPQPVVRTKGDANVAVDPWDARLAGTTAWKVRAVLPWWGRFVALSRSPMVRFGALLAGALLLLFLVLRAIWASPTDRSPAPTDVDAPATV